VLGLGENRGAQIRMELSKRRVLIVEDEPVIRNLVRAVLGRAGIAAEEAADGTEALRLLSSRTYDVVVLDLMLPGVSGFALLDSIRQQCHGCVVVLTAAADHELTALPRDVVFDVVRKPFSVDDLASTVRRAMAPQGRRKSIPPESQHRAENR
jgi:two-component system, OmpR family, response regulator ResD